MDSDKLSRGAPGHSAGLIQIEVAYARPDQQRLIAVAIEAGATVEDAIRRSGVLESFPEINLDINKVGVFGKLGKLDAHLRVGDRVEIYRALLADPKEMRRQRVMQGKKNSVVKMPKNQGEGVGSTVAGVDGPVDVVGAGSGGVPPGRV